MFAEGPGLLRLGRKNNPTSFSAVHPSLWSAFPSCIDSPSGFFRWNPTQPSSFPFEFWVGGPKLLMGPYAHLTYPDIVDPAQRAFRGSMLVRLLMSKSCGPRPSSPSPEKSS